MPPETFRLSPYPLRGAPHWGSACRDPFMHCGKSGEGVEVLGGKGRLRRPIFITLLTEQLPGVPPLRSGMHAKGSEAVPRTHLQCAAGAGVRSGHTCTGAPEGHRDDVRAHRTCTARKCGAHLHWRSRRTSGRCARERSASGCLGSKTPVLFRGAAAFPPAGSRERALARPPLGGAAPAEPQKGARHSVSPVRNLEPFHLRIVATVEGDECCPLGL